MNTGIFFEFKNIRRTQQRQVILEELSKLTSHPTATEIYDLVRKRLPRIGLGTVYRNLDAMASCGMITKLDVGGPLKRFDATTTPHYHIRCISCGKVEDVNVMFETSLEDKAAQATNYQITGHHIEFEGTCRTCQKSTGKENCQSHQT